MRWSHFWPYAQTGWGWTVAIATALLAIYYGPRRVLETYDWYLDRFFDSKVRHFVDGRRTPPQQTSSGHFMSWGTPTSVSEIAAATKLSEKRVRASLARLEKKKAAVALKDGNWKAPDSVT
jgi:hypothetical protein